MRKQRCFQILNLKIEATDEEVKKAFKTKAKIYHPDRGGNSEKFEEIVMAKNSILKRKFDEIDDDIVSENTKYQENDNHVFKAYPKHSKKQKTVFKTLHVSISEAYNGTKKTFTLKNQLLCDNCINICNTCNGHGKILMQTKVYNVSSHWFNKIIVICNICQGNKVFKTIEKCSICNDKQILTISKEMEIIIPEQCLKGFLIKFFDVIKDVDVVMCINVMNNKYFSLENEGDLIHIVSIDFVDTIFGKELKINHPSGHIFVFNTKSLSINDIMNGNDIKFLTKGLTKEHSLILKFEVNYPKIRNILNSEEEELKECKRLLQLFYM
jgi:DnaJ-class molecular chaperone